MQKNTCMNFLQFHFMYHRFYSGHRKFVDKNCIIMVHIRFDGRINCIAQKKGLIVKIYFYIHVDGCLFIYSW